MIRFTSFPVWMASIGFAVATPQEFTLAAFWDPDLVMKNSGIQEDIRRLGVARRCEFNLLMGLNGHPKGLKFNSEKMGIISRVNGLGGLITDNRIWEGDNIPFDSALAERISDDYRSFGSDSLVRAKRRAMVGYFISDEPSPKRLTPGTNQTEMENNARWAEYLQSRDTGKIVLSILYPYAKNGGPVRHLFDDTSEYKRYVARYLGSPRLKMAALDYYPFLEGGAWQSYGAENSYFYRNLGWFAEQIKAGDRARFFWATVLSSAVPPYANVTKENLGIMAYAPIVYGAKGLIYYTYMRLNSDYTSYLVDSMSRPHRPNYGLVQSLNGRIKRLGPTLIRLEWIAAVHGGVSSTGTGPVTDPESGEPGLPGVASTASIQDVLPGGSNLDPALVVGIARHEVSKRLHLLILNKDRMRSHSGNIQVRGIFRPERFRTKDMQWVAAPHHIDSTGATTAFSLDPIAPAELEMVRLSPTAPKTAVKASDRKR